MVTLLSTFSIIKSVVKYSLNGREGVDPFEGVDSFHRNLLKRKCLSFVTMTFCRIKDTVLAKNIEKIIYVQYTYVAFISAQNMK